MVGAVVRGEPLGALAVRILVLRVADEEDLGGEERIAGCRAVVELGVSCDSSSRVAAATEGPRLASRALTFLSAVLASVAEVGQRTGEPGKRRFSRPVNTYPNRRAPDTP